MQTALAPEIISSRKTRTLYTLSSLGVSIPVEAVSGIIMFYIVDVKNLPAPWFATFWVFYTIYNALNNPLLGFLSDRTHSRWGRRIPYILFSGIPYVLTFAILFLSPFDGQVNPTALLIFFGTVIVLWEGLYTALATGYYSLLPEMFASFQERTDVAAKMNIFQTAGLVIGVALPPILSDILGWSWMAIILASVAVIAIYLGLPAMYEKKNLQEQSYVPFFPALKATFINRSFVMAAIAQAMRFFGTGVLQAGMMFYMKYCLKVDEGLTTIIFGVAFIVAAAMLYPWRQLIANRTDSRTTLILANLVMIVAVVPLGFSTSLLGALIAAVLIGIGLSGLILIGDVIIAGVVDEDEVKVGQQRAGMYFGISGFIITLSGMLVSGVFGMLLPRYGYNTLLEVQPASVELGFRIFLTIPPIVGFILAIVALYFYPLHGERLKAVKNALQEKSSLAFSLDNS
jgi:GPH family glycoside/pentoside/hexuronide:cation symporter